MGRIRIGLLLSIAALVVAAGLLSAQAGDSAAGAAGDSAGFWDEFWSKVASPAALWTAILGVFAAFLKLRMDLTQFKLLFKGELTDKNIIDVIRNQGQFITEEQHEAAKTWLRRHDTELDRAENRLKRHGGRLKGVLEQLTRHSEELNAKQRHLHIHEVAIARIQTELTSITTMLRDLRSHPTFVPMEQFSTQLARIEANLLEVRDDLKAKLEDPEMRRKEAEDVRRIWQGLSDKEPLDED